MWCCYNRNAIVPAAAFYNVPRRTAAAAAATAAAVVVPEQEAIQEPKEEEVPAQQQQLPVAIESFEQHSLPAIAPALGSLPPSESDAAVEEERSPEGEEGPPVEGGMKEEKEGTKEESTYSTASTAKITD